MWCVNARVPQREPVHVHRPKNQCAMNYRQALNESFTRRTASPVVDPMWREWRQRRLAALWRSKARAVELIQAPASIPQRVPKAQSPRTRDLRPVNSIPTTTSGTARHGGPEIAGTDGMEGVGVQVPLIALRVRRAAQLAWGARRWPSHSSRSPAQEPAYQREKLPCLPS
jgi:hypothetical protein